MKKEAAFATMRSRMCGSPAFTLLLLAMTCLACSADSVRLPGVGAPNPFDGGVAPVAGGVIDKLVFGRLKTLGIEPAPLCTDAVFVRRAFLDVIGTLPTAQEARAFIESRDPAKRSALIEGLLAREEFADYWTMKWCNLLRVKSEFPINLWPNAVQAYHRWIRTCVRDNVPYDRFAREMLTSSGSNFRKPQVNFYRAVQGKDPPSLAQAVALTFMGTRVETWPNERRANLAVFFSRVGYKITSEWKEEIVFFDIGRTTATPSAVLPDGTTVNLSPMQDPRAVFADWLIQPTNPWFTRPIANRAWCWLLGRGILHEPDDIRADNPPRNPELLRYLEQELVASQYDLRRLFRLILNSQTYQLSCIPRSASPEAEAEFACYPPRRLEAEVLIDAINQVTGTTEKYISRIPEPFTYVPEEKRSIALADASITSAFLDLFGRCPRNTGLESEQRSQLPTSAQQLHLLNSSHIRNKLEQGPTIRALLQSAQSPRDVASSLYLTILSRYPAAEELAAVEAHALKGTKPERAGAELLWALINSAEFQFRH
ncbi:MAG: DUF1553 domain-containing protein [Lentisphaerae bacterium]|nr:DUF1553 domain-containing protein [Lentisphaerota bacterium]